jgi:formiminotetrahydrofolate cyclodeaminase
LLLTDKPLRDLLAAFASPDPTPGGGSASAVASAIGASLLMMVAGLPKTRTGSDDERAMLAGAAAALAGLQQQLTEAVDLDAAAYDQVVSAFKLPKGSDGEQTERKAAIQRAMRGATDVPLGVMRLSAMAVKQAETVAAHGHRAASSDVGVAVALIGAGFRGARLNVEINLGSLSDSAYVEAVKGELERLEKETASALSGLRAARP